MNEIASLITIYVVSVILCYGFIVYQYKTYKIDDRDFSFASTVVFIPVFNTIAIAAVMVFLPIIMFNDWVLKKIKR